MSVYGPVVVADSPDRERVHFYPRVSNILAGNQELKREVEARELTDNGRCGGPSHWVRLSYLEGKSCRVSGPSLAWVVGRRHVEKIFRPSFPWLWDVTIDGRQSGGSWFWMGLLVRLIVGVLAGMIMKMVCCCEGPRLDCSSP